MINAKVSTITLNCKFNKSFDITKMNNHSPNFTYKYNKSRKNVVLPGISNFFNSITIQEDNKGISYKIFSNGSVQLTGVKTLDTDSVFNNVYSLINDNFNECFDTSDELKIIKKNISMIKVYIKTHEIDINELKLNINNLKLNEHIPGSWLIATSNPKQSIKAKYLTQLNNECSIIIFRTGTICIHCKNINEIGEIYSRILELL